MHALGLHSQEILERKGIAPLLQGQHDLASTQALDMHAQVRDCRARDGAFDDRRAIAHVDEAQRREPATRIARQVKQAAGPLPRAQHDDPAPKGLGSQSPRCHQSVCHEDQQGETHRVEQYRSPESGTRNEEIDERDAQHAEAYGDQQPGRAKAYRTQRLRSVGADRDHREPDDQHEAAQLRQAIDKRSAGRLNLRHAQPPRRLAGCKQQQQVDEGQKHYIVGKVVLENADHSAGSCKFRCRDS